MHTRRGFVKHLDSHFEGRLYFRDSPSAVRKASGLLRWFYYPLEFHIRLSRHYLSQASAFTMLFRVRLFEVSLRL